MYWTHGWGKWSGRVGVRASAGNCGCKLSVCALFQHNYSSSPFMFAVCDYYTDAPRFSWTWHTQKHFWGKRHSSTTAAKLKSKVCVLISDGSFVNDSFNASVIRQINEKRRRWTNHLCFLISYLISWGCVIMKPYFMIKDCVWTCTGNLAIENITFLHCSNEQNNLKKIFERERESEKIFPSLDWTLLLVIQVTISL